MDKTFKCGKVAIVFTMVALLAIIFSTSSPIMPSRPARLLVSGGANSPTGESSPGIPWTGGVGPVETSQQIMERQAASSSTPGALPDAGVLDEFPQPDRSRLPQNPSSPAVSQWSSSPNIQTKGQAAAPSSPQVVGLTFTAATLSSFNPTYAFPPDSMGAVGPSQFVLMVNGRLVTFNKINGAADNILNLSPDAFFPASVRGGTTISTSDPRIRYDRLSARWFMIMITTTAPNRVVMAVSDGAGGGTISASTAWHFYSIPIDLGSPAYATCLFDYPTLGIDVNALYIGGNDFCGSPLAYTGSDGFVIRKSDLLAGTLTVTVFRGLVASAQASGPFTPQGVDNEDPAATEGYFIGVDSANLGSLILRRVSKPGGAPGISGNIYLTVPQTQLPPTVPHKDNANGFTGNLDSIDDRLMMAHIRNGSLWTAHDVGVDSSGVSNSSPDRTAARWYQIGSLTGSPVLIQSGTVFDPASANPQSYFIPSIMPNGQGNVALGFSAAGANDYANAAFTGRLAGDPQGAVQAPQLYTGSSAAYNPPNDPGSPHGRRWGDYSYTSLDPCDDMTLWTIQEFTYSSNVYGVQVAKLPALPPATPGSASPSQVDPGLSSVNVTINGNSVSGSGFFDPGQGFGCRLSASVSGGVMVNRVTYIDPTHLSLNLSTVNAAPGQKDLTITNPDGQQVKVTGLLTVQVVHAYADPRQKCAGNVPCFGTIQQALDRLPDNGRVTVYGTHTITTTLSTGGSGANSATLDGNGTVSWKGGAGSLFSVGSGNLTLSGLTFSGGISSTLVTTAGSGSTLVKGSAISGFPTVFSQNGSGGITAYANNISGYTTGYSGSGAPLIGHNYWGSTDPLASAPSGMSSEEWAKRLAAPVVAWADGDGNASLAGVSGTASLGGGTGTAVVVSYGRGQAHTPFGDGALPAGVHPCSEYYDFFTVGGGGMWSLQIPVDFWASCRAVRVVKSAYWITSQANCSPATNPACWSALPANRLLTSGTNLVVSQLSVSELGGTPFVLGGAGYFVWMPFMERRP